MLKSNWTRGQVYLGKMSEDTDGYDKPQMEDTPHWRRLGVIRLRSKTRKILPSNNAPRSDVGDDRPQRMYRKFGVVSFKCLRYIQGSSIGSHPFDRLPVSGLIRS